MKMYILKINKEIIHVEAIRQTMKKIKIFYKSYKRKNNDIV